MVASCSPHMHLKTFRKAAQAAGLNPYLVEMANIREHCSWVHHDRGAGHGQGHRDHPAGGGEGRGTMPRCSRFACR